MLGRINPEIKEVNIIGSGMAGLLAGYTMVNKGFNVRIYEASDRAGGLIETAQHELGIIEKAAHSVMANSSFF
jgi:protoporphyrinogen oxidase